MIDIIIPAYNASETIERTLYSISYQTIVDKVNVYIINDAGKENYKKYIDFFKRFMNIKEIKLKKNGGPGVAREEGIKNSRSNYITFIDSDDIFSNPKSIEYMYNAIKKNNSDIVVADFYEQSTVGEYRLHSHDTTWMHGKMYRRSFLKKKNIHFNDSRANEDNAFNHAIFIRDPKVTYLNKDVYYWLYNKNSITRSNNCEYNYTGIFGYVENMVYVLEGAIKDKVKPDKIAALAISVFYAMYYYYLNWERIELAKASKRLLEIVDEYPVKDADELTQIIKDQFFTSFDVLDKEKLANPKIDIMEFVKLVEES